MPAPTSAATALMVELPVAVGGGATAVERGGET